MPKTNELPVITRADLEKYAPNLNLTDAQIKLLLSATPKRFIKTRKGRGGKNWDYVNVYYVTKVLNLLYGFNWSFEVKDQAYDLDIGQAYVLGRLTVPGLKNPIFKEQYGRVEIKYFTDQTLPDGRRRPLDLGNDLKAAASDALKKCASLIGIAVDIYAKDDFVEVQYKAPAMPADAARDRLFKFLAACQTADEVDLLVEDYEAQGLELSKADAVRIADIRNALI